jgi:hypothetical protein
LDIRLGNLEARKLGRHVQLSDFSLFLLFGLLILVLLFVEHARGSVHQLVEVGLGVELLLGVQLLLLSFRLSSTHRRKVSEASSCHGVNLRKLLLLDASYSRKLGYLLGLLQIGIHRGSSGGVCWLWESDIGARGTDLLLGLACEGSEPSSWLGSGHLSSSCVSVRLLWLHSERVDVGQLRESGDQTQRVAHLVGSVSLLRSASVGVLGLEFPQNYKGVGNLEPGIPHQNVELLLGLHVVRLVQLFDSPLSVCEGRALLDDLVVDEKGFFGLLALFIQNSQVEPNFRDVSVDI